MKKILLIILFLFLVLYDAFTYAHIIQNELSKNVIRLHVVANSDTQVDQELKLKVRDSILEFMENNNFENLEVAYNSVANSLEKIENIAKNTLAKTGCYKDVKSELSSFYFPQKNYDTLSFPAGNYTALKITIGEGEGQNWWCVMYPTLCFSENICSANEATLTLKESLSKESFHLITKKSNFRFKIVDFFNSKP